MTIFRRVAEAGSFSAVARETRLSQPTISKQVAALEARLGVKLISRSTRQLSLTEAGQAYYQSCTRILDELEETESALGEQDAQPSGTLRVAAPATFGRMHVVPHLWGFMDRYPDLKVELTMDDRYVDLVKEGVDMTIRVGALRDSNLVARKLGDSPRVALASPAYLETHGEPKTVADLKAHACIVYNLLSTRNEWHFHGPRGKEAVRVSGRFSADSPDAVRASILAGQGIAVTPAWLMNDCIEDGKVIPVLQDYTPTPMQIHALYPERRFVSAKVRTFIDHLREALAGLRQ